MRPIAIDTHDFPSLRRDGKIYVDKTMFMHRLVANDDARHLFAAERYEETSDNTSLQLQLKTPTQKV